MSSSTGVSPEKEIREHEHSPANGMRHRGDATSRMDYNNPIGGPVSENGAANSGASITPHKRREIRRRLRQKHNHVAPMVRWTKFMHSDTKNRTF